MRITNSVSRCERTSGAFCPGTVARPSSRQGIIRSVPRSGQRLAARRTEPGAPFRLRAAPGALLPCRQRRPALPAELPGLRLGAALRADRAHHRLDVDSLREIDAFRLLDHLLP